MQRKIVSHAAWPSSTAWLWHYMLTVVPLLLLLSTSWASATASACTSGILQINPAAQGDIPWKCMKADADPNSIKAICGAAFKVTVDKNTIVRMVPLEKGTFNVTPMDFAVEDLTFDCKNLNASGVLNAGSTTSATVMLYNDVGGKLSNLTKTGPNQVALQLAHSINGRGDPTLYCTLNYTVASGCVLGAKAAAPTPCSPGYIIKTGRFGLQYCAPCPKGTYSPGGVGATSCIPCPVGTASDIRGATSCTACILRGGMAAKEGSTQCTSCAASFFGSTGTKWTDGLATCGDCPPGSVGSMSNVTQCVKCNAGKKCCTVNWDKDCPKCSSGVKPSSHTSTFALESAVPASCMATDYAFCAPKIRITINGKCQVSITTAGYQDYQTTGIFCDFRTSLPIQGLAVNAIRDLSKLTQGLQQSEFSIFSGSVTSAASPYLDISAPTAAGAKCTFRYRALTKPAAVILGAAPKAASAGPCPAGKYRDTSTDTPPGPCLPCPRGTFSTRPGVCTPCPAGTYSKYGSKTCAACPMDTVAAAAGSSICKACNIMTYPSADRRTCVRCPKNTFKRRPGGSCLGNSWGSICCAASASGACSKQAPGCAPKFTPAKGAPPYVEAIFRLKVSSHSSPSCKNATLLTCLRVGSKLVVATSTSYNDISLYPSGAGATCIGAGKSYFGSYVATNRAVVQQYTLALAFSNGPWVSYELLSNAAANTFTMYLSRQTRNSLVIRPPAPIKECSATFELLYGFFLDLKPPLKTKCPPAAKAIKVNGRILCQFCGAGKVRKATGACQACPKGTYQPLVDGTACKPCPAGYRCPAGATIPIPCNLGHYAPRAGLANCLRCRAGTYNGGGTGFKACFKCPAGTSTPAASRACIVPFATTFS